MRRTFYFVMALAMVLGFTQCKKEQPLDPTNNGSGVRITLNVEKGGNNGTRVDVAPPHVDFEEGDQILVGYNGAYVGTLTHNGEHFAGSIDATVMGSQKLYFYFVGNKNKTGASISVGAESYTVDISDQTTELPVLSFSASNEDFTGAGSYSASLHNQCALVKFNLSTGTDAAVSVGGLYTKATIDFTNPGVVTPGTEGTITLHSGASNTEKWAILLPQTSISATATVSGYPCSISSIPNIENNAYLNSGVAINLVQTVTWDSYFLGDHHHIDTYGGATSFTENGITVTVSGVGAQFDGDNQIYLSSSSDKLNFASSGGRKMTKIEITYGSCKGTPSSSWTKSGDKLTWTGSSTSVDLTCTSSGGGGIGIGIGTNTNDLTLSPITQIQFTFEN